MENWRGKELEKEVRHLISMAEEYINTAQRTLSECESWPTLSVGRNGGKRSCPHCRGSIWFASQQEGPGRLCCCMSCKRNYWVEVNHA